MSAIDEIKAALGERFDHRARYAVYPADHEHLKRFAQVGTLNGGNVVVDLDAPAEPAPPAPPPAQPARRFTPKAGAVAGGEET